MRDFRNRKLNRRTVLRGAGVALSLPMLDAMLSPIARAQARNPQNFLAIYFPFGTMGSGDTVNHYHLGADLSSLRGRFDRRELVIFNDIQQAGGDIHAVSTFLTANASNRGWRGIVLGESFDYYLSRQLPWAKTSPQSLWVLGTRDFVNDPGLFRSYASWRGVGQHIPKEMNLQQVYQNLTRGAGRVDLTEENRRKHNVRMNLSAVDGAWQDAKSLLAQLGSQDRITLESYLNDLKKIEDNLSKDLQSYQPKPLPNYRAPTVTDHQVNNFGPFMHKTRAMIELSVIAMATGVTHVSSIVLDQAVRGLAFEDGLAYHNTVVHGVTDRGELREPKAKIHQAMAELMEFAIAKAQQYGIWNDLAIVLGTECGVHHRPNNSIVLGSGGLYGSVLGTERSYNNQAMGKIYVSLAQKMGLDIDRFGAGQGTLWSS